MSKAKRTPARVTSGLAEAPETYGPTGETRGTISLRIEGHTRRLIDEAAAVLGKTRTEFMLESARRLAIDVLLDQRLFVLDGERYDAFVHVLDNPPPPGRKLRALLRRAPAWGR